MADVEGIALQRYKVSKLCPITKPVSKLVQITYTGERIVSEIDVSPTPHKGSTTHFGDRVVGSVLVSISIGCGGMAGFHLLFATARRRPVVGCRRSDLDIVCLDGVGVVDRKCREVFALDQEVDEAAHDAHGIDSHGECTIGVGTSLQEICDCWAVVSTTARPKC